MQTNLQTKLFMASMGVIFITGVTAQACLWCSHNGDAAMHRLTDAVNPMVIPGDGTCAKIELPNHKLQCFNKWKKQHSRLMVGAS